MLRLSIASPGCVVRQCAGHCSMRKQPDELSDIAVVAKIFSTNITDGHSRQEFDY